jgi:hypothetical protein
MKRAAIALGALWLLVLLGAWGLDLAPPGLFSLGSALDWMVLLGGPGLLPLGILLGAWRESEAGALLWLGAAVAAVGLSLRSGPHLGSYFLGMGLLVLPQVATGTLFLLHARRRQAAPPVVRRRRR